MNAGTLVKTTLVDFPGRVAAAVFLTGCNLRCPYCYNRMLVEPGARHRQETAAAFVTEAEILAHLEKRRHVLTGLVISGGEPLLNPLTPGLITKARALGYRIKLDTNGTLPERLADLCGAPELRPDYIAMDIKTSPHRYATLTGGTVSPSRQEKLTQSILRSIQIIRTQFPSESREWRTVLVPPLVSSKEIEDIAALLPQDAKWYLSPFRNDECLDSTYTGIIPYTQEQMDSLTALAGKHIPAAVLR